VSLILPDGVQSLETLESDLPISSSFSQTIPGGYNLLMLPDLQLKDTVRMRKPHPCGSSAWKVTRLGADIGLECLGCGRRILLTRRELQRRAKTVNPAEPRADTDQESPTPKP
jgi:hypothetical protein